MEKETEDERIRISEAVGCDWKTIRSQWFYTMNERDANLKKNEMIMTIIGREKRKRESNMSRNDRWDFMQVEIFDKINLIEYVLYWTSSTWTELTKLWMRQLMLFCVIFLAIYFLIYSFKWQEKYSQTLMDVLIKVLIQEK